MSTFLVGLVVAAATVFVIWVAVSDPEQPATLRHPNGRERPRRRRRAPRRRRSPRRPPARAWVRVRSGLALVVLVTFVGVLMAVTMGASLALAARALRHAVG